MHFFLKIGLQVIKVRNLILLVSTVLFVILCTVVMYYLEPENFEDLPNTFYYVMTTFSTVGYGDYSPVTLAGKMFAIVMYIIGIGLLGAVIGKVIDALSFYRRKKEEGKLAYTDKDHIVIVGWSKKTETAVEELLSSNSSVEVVVIDTFEKAPFDVGRDRLHYIQGDPTEEESFKDANITGAKSVIIFADDKITDPSLRDPKTLAVAITAERLSPDVHTTVEILAEKNMANFSHVKVDEFILSQEMVSNLAVRAAMYEGVSKLYSQLISRQHGDDLFKISKKDSWHTYQDAFQELLKQGATLIADHDKMDINRRLDEKIPASAELYVICNRDVYEKIKDAK